MKRLILPLAIAVIVISVASSCKKTAESLFSGFDATLSEVELTLPPVNNTTLPFPVPFPMPAEVPLGPVIAQHFDVDSLIKKNTGNSFSYADITSIKLKSMTMMVDNATPASNLTNFESARFTMYTNTNSTVVEILNINPFPTARQDTLVIAPSDPAELKNHLNGKELFYQIYGRMRAPTFDSLHIRVKTIVTVK